MPPLAIMGGLAAAGSIGGGALAAHAAGKAADTQTEAANHAADLQKQEADQALAFQKQVYGQGQENQYPFLTAGQHAVTSLNDLMGLPGIKPYQDPNAMPPPAAPPSTDLQKLIQNGRMQGLAKGGMAKASTAYLVGERGPEILKMHKGGHGTVIPLSQLSGTVNATPRAFGGPVDYRPPIRVGGTGTLNTGGTQPPISLPARTGQLANPPQNNLTAPALPGFGAQSNNPLITGGSSTPIQSTPFTQWSQQFQAPTAADARNEPGYQFQLQQGQDAILNNASAMGTTGSAATGAALAQYAQGLGQQDYQNVYNRARQNYFDKYNIFNNNQTGQFNRLASLGGLGQTSAGSLQAGGQAAAGNVGNILGNAGQQIGQNINNAGAAAGSGYVGAGNAWGGALSNLGNLGQLSYLQQFLKPAGGYGSGVGV